MMSERKNISVFCHSEVLGLFYGSFAVKEKVEKRHRGGNPFLNSTFFFSYIKIKKNGYTVFFFLGFISASVISSHPSTSGIVFVMFPEIAAQSWSFGRRVFLFCSRFEKVRLDLAWLDISNLNGSPLN